MRSTVRLRAEFPEDIFRAAAILRGGGLLALPTETVYGLGADALSPEAVERIFVAKQRPAWDPLIVHLAGVEWLEQVARLSPALRARVEPLAATFWPGPLTLLLPRQAAVPDAVTAGRDKVGVRVPAHPVALQLLRAVGRPLAAPSANRFGHTSPTTADHVLADLAGRVDAVLDAGACRVGVESTVVDPTETPMVVYRAGAVTAEALRRVSGVETIAYVPGGLVAEPPAALPSPGVGLRHYAPAVPLQLSAGNEAALWQGVTEAKRRVSRVGVLLPRDWVLQHPEVPQGNGMEGDADRIAEDLVLQPWGRWTDEEALARELFAAMRALEGAEVDLILGPLPEPGGLRDAIRDRLLKAAKPRGLEDVF